MAIYDLREVKAKFAHSSLPIELQPSYVEARRKVDFWIRRWKAGNNNHPMMDIDLTVPDDLFDEPTWPTGRIFLAAAIIGPPVIYAIVQWWKWWLA
jgi:hypothetical protein